jgi:pyruvate kinase
MHIWFTYGPSTAQEPVIEKVLLAGATGCRLTFSFSTRERQEEHARIVKRAADRASRPCVVVADLAGEKIRLGDFPVSHVPIAAGEIVTLNLPGTQPDVARRLFPVTSRRLFECVQPSDGVVMGDGSLVLRVTSVTGEAIQTTALQAGVANPNRGLTIQGGHFTPASLTSKDVADLEFIARSPLFDVVLLSFVAGSDSIIKAREILRQAHREIPIIAKIETAQGLRHLSAIAEAADMIMAARGDLALTVDWIELPGAVEAIAQVAKEQGKPWILATQVVEGLERFAFPTRAEICDLAHWLKQGTAGVMLCYETAFGPKPVDAISAVQSMVHRWAGGASGR